MIIDQTKEKNLEHQLFVLDTFAALMPEVGDEDDNDDDGDDDNDGDNDGDDEFDNGCCDERKWLGCAKTFCWALDGFGPCDIEVLIFAYSVRKQ